MQDNHSNDNNKNAGEPEVLKLIRIIINPRRACAERVTVVVSCGCVGVCLSVCMYVCMSVRTRYSGSTRS